MSKVADFLDIFKQVTDGLAERQLEAFALPDVVWKIANYIDSDGYKKNGYNQPPNAVKQADKPVAGATRTVSGKLEIKKDPEKKTGKNGKPFTVYALKVNGEWLNTTDAKALSGGPFSVGEELIVELVANNQGYWNITSISKDGATSDEDIPW
jgi:hypothetical protein